MKRKDEEGEKEEKGQQMVKRGKEEKEQNVAGHEKRGRRKKEEGECSAAREEKLHKADRGRPNSSPPLPVFLDLRWWWCTTDFLPFSGGEGEVFSRLRTKKISGRGEGQLGREVG